MFNYSSLRISYLASIIILITSCSVNKQISRSAQQLVIKDSSLLTAHVGISIYEPSTSKYWFNYQGDKYFVPASNTKIPTCYAAMKYLGDSLVGLRYQWLDYVRKYNILPTADPTFLHPDFNSSNVLNFFRKNVTKEIAFNFSECWFEFPFGSGWAWNDYNEYYMAERSPFPIYGNTVRFKRNGNIKITYVNDDSSSIEGINIYPKYFKKNLFGYDSVSQTNNIKIYRNKEENIFQIYYTKSIFNSSEIPFITSALTNLRLLRDTVLVKFSYSEPNSPNDKFWEVNVNSLPLRDRYSIIHSQPTDSLLKPMMHRSDNFFAEQTLLMVSNEMLGVMNDEKIIDTLLKTDFKDLPQKPRWVDGSGLSRYNLFTPQDFVFVLNKIKNDFPMERIKEILPTGGEGTLSSYYKTDSGYIYAKTGTLSGVVALSGYLYTKKNKLLIFSVLVNNHQSSATAVRKAVEKFIRHLRNKY